MPEDSTLVSTRRALHAVAEQVLAGARFAAVGRIGLTVAPGGFTTPPFGDDGRRLAVDVDELVVVNREGERRQRLTTLRAAGAFAGFTPMAPAVYTASTHLDPDETLAVDPDTARTLAAWFALVDDALRRFTTEVTDVSPITLWPEHFDVALTAEAVNYGGSPGDDEHDEPYLYVGPHARPLPAGSFWNEPFGASLTRADVADVDAALAFFRAGRDAVR